MDKWHIAVLQWKIATIQEDMNMATQSRVIVMEMLSAEDLSIEEEAVRKHAHDWWHMPCSLVWAVHNAWLSMTPYHSATLSM